MSAFVIVASAADRSAAIHAGSWEQACNQLQLRAPGPIQELETGDIRVAVAGEFGALVHHDGFVAAFDGIPTFRGSRPALYTRDSRGRTEWLLELCNQWLTDKEGFLRGVGGSFSLAFCTLANGEITLLRDRFGTRPLYWLDAHRPGIAASEQHMLLPFVSQARLNAAALGESLKFRWVLGDSSLIDSVRQVPPASQVTLHNAAAPSVRRYWQMRYRPDQDGRPMTDYVIRTRDALREAYSALQLDTKRVGVLLSGGIDSSVLAAVGRDTLGKCVGFVGRLRGAAEESRRAERVAEYLGIECRVVDIDDTRFVQDFPRVIRRIGEPPRHANDLVLHQLLERAATEVDVVVNGDGAEMMFGLAHSRWVETFRRKRRVVEGLMPAAVRRLAAKALGSIDSDIAARLERLSRHDALSYATSMDQIEYSHAVRRALLKLLGDELVAGCSRTDAFTRYDHFDDALQVYKIETVLESSLLRHDRLSEPLGIEPVAPFLAEPVVEVSETLPREFRYSGAAKPVLRALCGELLPAEVARWPKMGFEVPWRGWLRQQLRSFREETSRDIRLRSLVSPEYFDAVWHANDPEAEWTLMTLGLLVRDWTEPASSQRSRGGGD